MAYFDLSVENDSPLTGEEPVHVIDSRKHPELPQNQSRPETIETSQGQDEKVDSSKTAPNGSQGDFLYFKAKDDFHELFRIEYRRLRQKN